MPSTTLTVPRYDRQTRRYTGQTVPLLLGRALDEHLQQRYHSVGSRARSAYLRDNDIHLADVYRVLEQDPRRLSGAQVRAIVGDDQLRPWFGPTAEEGLRLGLEGVQVLWEPLIGTTVPVDATVVEWFSLEGATTDDDFELRTIGQGGEIPVGRITLGKQSIILDKKGRGLQWTKESLRAPVALSQLWLRVIGQRIGRGQLAIVADRAVNGYLDDNSDDPVIVDTATAHAFSYVDLLTALDAAEAAGFPATDMLASPATLIALKTLQWPVSGLPVFPNSIQETLGVEPHRVQDLDDEQIVFLNREAALVRYEAEAFGTEDDYLPSRQVYSIYGTMTDQITTGMAKARVVLNANHA